jgi:hypothetical protein
MTAPRRSRRPGGRSPSSRSSGPIDIWRPAPELPEPAPIVRANDPTALLRSLGEPPLWDKSAVAGQYLAAVVERAAALAAGMAASADLLVDPDAD